ncbi:electrogenic sodium bicarbonate cotransporter 4-like isoform X6 [Acipenser ruthenus]|uniref:electrogenic sodium bicarbonate cotransporter 4-like isoform X6 n=1 Tax=Acipenser ruthenus TaxID=7906 RepID=UPI00274100DA|nr:electrogenic sodium bicarbonate cotransporter 4-like isoform X6 [Acipenser ruthenus]XP_058864631.1 electrogenic sodium bicarbonate cotransporter 4-like isoform X6 [Acipenser ruthenus]
MDHDGLGDRERGVRNGRRRYAEEEDEDHHSIYIGVPEPRGYRRKRRRRRSTSSRDNGEGERERHYERARQQQTQPSDTDEGGRGHSPTPAATDDINRTISPAAERLRYILGEDDELPNPTLFTEMDTLQHDGDELEWKESARWVKFEEKVEEGGERWSKPHVSTLSLHSLFELRTCLQTGTVLLDLEGYSLPQIIDDIIEKQVEDGLIKAELRDKISFVLLRKHRHQTKKPIHRSLADMGKSVSSPSNRSPSRSPSAGANLHRSSEDLRTRQAGSYGRLRQAHSRSMNDISDTLSTDQLKNKFMKKIPRDAEASNVLVGEVDFLDKPFVAFVRLAQATTLGGLTEVPVPTRFLFVLLGPQGKGKSYNEIGRAIATLMVDDLFSDVAYKARDRDDLIAGIDEFLDEVIVLPPGEWDPTIRIEPPKKIPSAEKRKSVFSLNEAGQMNGLVGGGGGPSDDEEMPAPHELGEELQWTGRFCGGLYLDLKRKLHWFPSDFYDGIHIQSISAILFIYLGCITNAITFGGLLGDATDNYQGVMESFIGTAMAGSVFCFFAGQPLIILSSTGPILIFEKLLFDFSKGNDIDYMEFRLWIGLHSCLQCLILVATDASFIIKYITRFTEEGFSTLISFIFIYDAIKKMIGAFKYYPINSEFKPDYVTAYKCECVAPDPVAALIFNGSAPFAPNDTNVSVYNPVNATALDWSQLSKKECLKYGGSLVGNTCKYVPDLALMSFILFFGTYSMTVSLKKFKFSRYFPTKLRKLISDFSIFMSIMMFVGLDMLVGLNTPKLIVPTEFKPTRADRGWFVLPFGKNPWWVYVASAVPALLVTILIFMDQQISAVIVNRKEHKLKKGCGYHMDLFWVGLLMAACSFMGLPWYVAATVISIAHIDSLKMETESSAPGEQPQFLGVREQRLTGIVVFILTGVSIFLAPILQYIPMPVLYGVFLYMGVASLNGIQFWDRCKLYLMPAKHQPDYTFLRHVPLRRVHLFTVVQIVCLTVLWVLKSTMAAIIFPVMILGLIIVRKMLDWVFSQHDLAWLDDILPEKDKKKEEDKKKKKKKKKNGRGEEGDSEDESKPPVPVKIPMDTLQPDPVNSSPSPGREGPPAV